MIFGEEGFEPDPFAETCFILEVSGEVASFLIFLTSQTPPNELDILHALDESPSACAKSN